MNFNTHQRFTGDDTAVAEPTSVKAGDAFFAPLEEAIQDGAITPNNGMRFRDAVSNLRRHFRPTPELDFQRALFRYLKQRLGLDTFAEVAQRFEFTEAETPLDDVDLSPELVAALKESEEKARAAEIELAQAQAAQAREFERRARADELKAEIVRIKEGLESLDGLKELLTAEESRIEKAIESEVYSMPKWSNFPNKLDFVMRRQADIVAIRSALAEHAGRLKVSKGILAEAEAELAELTK